MQQWKDLEMINQQDAVFIDATYFFAIIRVQEMLFH